MHTRYLDLLKEAVDDSLSLGLLNSERAPTFCAKKIPKENVLPLLGPFCDHLYSIGLSQSVSLSGNCIRVHDELQQFLLYHGIDAHMTIGSMHGQGWSYCAESRDVLLNEIADPDSGREIRIHTWLTLNDASIIDWTGQAWCDVQAKENHPAEKCLAYFPQGQQNETHYYMPKFVGREFLYRTRSIVRVPRD